MQTNACIFFSLLKGEVAVKFKRFNSVEEYGEEKQTNCALVHKSIKFGWIVPRCITTIFR